MPLSKNLFNLYLVRSLHMVFLLNVAMEDEKPMHFFSFSLLSKRPRRSCLLSAAEPRLIWIIKGRHSQRTVLPLQDVFMILIDYLRKLIGMWTKYSQLCHFVFFYQMCINHSSLARKLNVIFAQHKWWISRVKLASTSQLFGLLLGLQRGACFKAIFLLTKGWLREFTKGNLKREIEAIGMIFQH